MKKLVLLAAAAAATLTATAASAQPWGYGRDYDRRSYDRDYRYDRGHRYDRGYGYDRGSREDRHWNGRWARGGYLPPAYRHRGYVVYDYGRYRLRPPPRGYYWYRSGNDYVLAAIATGLILDVLAGDNGYSGGGYYGRGW